MRGKVLLGVLLGCALVVAAAVPFLGTPPWGMAGPGATPNASGNPGPDPSAHVLPVVNALSAAIGLRNPYLVWDSKEPDTQRAIASTTKMMTALLAIERTNLPIADVNYISINTMVPVSANAPAACGSCMGLVAGDQLALFDLLRGLLLESGNDAAIAIAEKISGIGAGADGGAFSDLMDDGAAALGMVDTDYANPHGRDAAAGVDQWSSARDLTILADFALQDPLFATIVNTVAWPTTTWVDNLNNPKDAVQCNSNSLILDGTLVCPVSGFLYPGAEGVKTGTTTNAGPSLVFAATRQGKSVLGSLLNSVDGVGTDTRYNDATALLDYGFGAITSGCTAAADVVDSFAPGPDVGAGFDDATDSLGDPDGASGGVDESASLGDGGTLVLRFTDNGLIDHNGPDIAVYEDPGTDERVEVEVSVDGVAWTSLGVIEGTAALDLEGSGVGIVNYVRLTDQDDGLTAAPSAGYDVDAVRAVNWKCPPAADAGANQVLECSGADGADVLLNGIGSSDPDVPATDTTPPGAAEAIASFDWYEDFGLVTEVLLGSALLLPVTLPLGAHAITLVTTDPWGLQDTDLMTVQIVDTTPPVIDVLALPPELWPPNHKYVAVDFDVEVEDVCDGAPTFVLLSASSDEPDDGRGDGHTVDDITGADFLTPDTRLLLRQERSGPGDGRTYTIMYEAMDASGNSAQAGAEVLIPHDRGPP